MAVVVAVDWGAASVRVCRVDLSARPPAVEVVHRHAHRPERHRDGSLRWAWDRLMAETVRGIDAAIAAGPVESIGVDTWGVDYGLLGADGRLLSPPHSYRSPRTASWRDVVDRVGERRLYELTGTQLQPFNTVFQLAAHDRNELARARHLLLLPDLVAHALNGWRLGDGVAADRTGAGTTGLLSLASGTWSGEVLDTLEVPDRLLPEIVEPGSPAGAFRGVPIVRVCGHDTASAVVALGPRGGSTVAFGATGTWLLVGREQPAPDVSVEAQAANFTNEQGAEGTIRFIKNVAGFWLLHECFRQWSVSDPGPLLAAAAGVDPAAGGIFDATHPLLLAPPDMDATIRALSGLDPDAPRPVVVRSIVESIAATVADTVGGFEPIEEVRLLGGGAAVPLLRDRLAARCPVPVRVGEVEAAAVGNALVQGVALGLFHDVADARQGLVDQR